MSLVNLFGAHVEPRVAFLILGEMAIAALIIAAISMAAIGRGRYHHYMILTAFLTDELIFKPLMYQRFSLGVFGPFPYSGTVGLAHILLAATATVLGAMTVYLGFRFRIKKGKSMFMPPKGRFHRIVGGLYVTVWFITLLFGLRIFIHFYM